MAASRCKPADWGVGAGAEGSGSTLSRHPSSWPYRSVPISGKHLKTTLFQAAFRLLNVEAQQDGLPWPMTARVYDAPLHHAGAGGRGGGQGRVGACCLGPSLGPTHVSSGR